MADHGSITRWFTPLKKGDEAAAQAIWERYCRQLLEVARQKLRPERRREADEEDIVQEAFRSFFRGVAGNRFQQLDDRDNLWRLLVVITARKAYDQIARQKRKRRGGGLVQTESRLLASEAEPDDPALQQIIGAEPTPAFAAQVAEQYQRLLEQLGERSLQQVALLKMEGFSNDEIAEKLKCSRRTVARKLDAIRTIWQEEQLS